ncbi:MAG: glycosyltransferase family 1 protein [Candidatus Hydrogenedentota bacterium]
MIIGYDATPITTGRTGVGSYCYNLLSRLIALRSPADFRLFTSGRGRLDLGPCELPGRHRHVPLPTRLVYGLWDTFGIPKMEGLLGPHDVYHATNYYLAPTRSAKRVLSIHDLTFIVRPEWCSDVIVRLFGKRTPRFAAEADAIITGSEASKKDIVERLGIVSNKVVVTLYAADPACRPVERTRALEEVRRELALEAPYFLYVGTLERRKNVANIVRAFGRIAADVPHSLVLAGGPGWGESEIDEAIRAGAFSDRIVRPGYVRAGLLPSLYSGADGFIFPSRYEGFGLPVLDAMTCGCPVVTSTSSSLPEVAGDAALIVDPEDVDALAECMRQIATDAELCDTLRAKGRAHAAEFSWDRCAAQTLDVYRSLCGNSRASA